MIFTPEEIQRMFDIIDYRLAVIVADILGGNALKPEDKEILKRNGYDWAKELKRIPPYYQSFLFGRLSGILTPTQLRSIDYKDFLLFIERKQYEELTEREKAVYNAAATRTYSYIKTMGQRMRDVLSNAISQEEIKILTEQQRKLELGTIKKEIVEGTLKKRSVQSIVSNIGHSLNDWNRDWGRIVETEMQNIFQIGIAETIMKEHGLDAIVYKEVFQGACFPIEDTEFLTNEGFKFLDEIRGDELIASYNLQTNTLEYTSIVNKVRYYYEGDMVSFKHRSLDMICTPNHKQLISIDRGLKNKWTENFLLDSDQIPKISKKAYMRYTVENWKGYNEEFINIAGIDFQTKDFVVFMAWYLSEGHCGKRKKDSKNRTTSSFIRISQRKEENFFEIESCLKAMFKGNVSKIKDAFSISLDRSYDLFIDWLKNLGDRAWTKRIPNEILNLSKDYLVIFYNTYIKGDGYCSHPIGSGSSAIITSSPQIRDAMCEIILKCGFRPSMQCLDNIGKETYSKKGIRFETKRLTYVVRALKGKNFTSVYKHFKILKNWKGFVGCLELKENHTLYIRRNGTCIWSGNCKHCIRLYTTQGIGSKPRLFKLVDLIANGDNIGIKVKDWKPTLGSVHPFCRCQIKFLPKGYEWDEETLQFRPPKEYKPKIERRSKVKIYVGNKKFEV